MPKRDGLYKRGKVWWLRCDPVTRERRSTGCTSKPAAEAFRAQRERLASDPSYAAAHEATVGKWLDELVKLKRQTKAEGTADMYETKAGHVRRILGVGCRMVDVDAGAVDRFISQRRDEGAVDYTIDKEFITIRQMCKMAKRAGEWSGDLETLRPEGFSGNYVPRTGTLTFEEVRQLFAVMPPDKVVAVALAGIGCRRAEVQRVRREHIDIERWTVRIPGTKTEQSDREIPVVLPTHRLLLQLAAESGCLPVSWPTMSAGLPKYCIKAGVPRSTPNDLRRSFASWNIEAGVSRENVAKLLGHASTAMVFRVYGRENPALWGETMRRQLPAPPENVGTRTSHYGYCLGGPGSKSVTITGVTDGDRTRDNRSHNPNQDPGNDAGSANPAPSRYPSVPQDPSTSPLVGTTTSQRQEADHVLHRLAAAGFRAQSAAWFRRAA
jgi:integrase